MGIEYQVKFRAPADNDLDARLRRLAFFGGFDEKHRVYNLWLDPGQPKSDWAHAVATINEKGIYFRDNCGPNVDAILGSVVRVAIDVSESQEVSVAEL